MKESTKIIKETLDLQNKNKKELVDKNNKLLESFISNNREEEYQEYVNKNR